MHDVQNLIDRQLGILSILNYDNVLKRLVVYGEESFYGLQAAAADVPLDHDPPIFACRFAEACGYEHILALANEDGRVAIQNTWNMKTAGSLEGFQCHNNAVFDLAWRPGHRQYVTVSGDHSACLWDVAEGAPRRVLMFSNHTRSVKTAVFCPTDPAVFATGARDGHILVWDIRANALPSVVHKPDNCLMNCHSSFTPKTPGSHGKRLRMENQRAISITGLVFQDDQTLLSCGECDGNIKVWDLRKNYNIYKREPLPRHSIPYCGSSTKNGYTNLIVDDARTRLYASCMDNVIYCFNISTYNSLPEQRYVGHENSTFYIKTGLSPDCMYLVSGSSDKHAYIWNVKCSEPVVRLAGHWAEVTCAAWGRAPAAALVTCSDDARHKIWRIGPEAICDELQLKGRAEVVPRAAMATLPRWGALDRTPNSLKRKLPTPGSYSVKRFKQESIRKTKRCLTDLMNAARDAGDEEASAKKRRLEPLEEPKRLGVKHGSTELETTPSKQKRSPDSEPQNSMTDWGYIGPGPGTSFMTPTKKYEKKNCKMLSPRSPKPISPKASPSKAGGVSFNTPLPDFVLDGQAPHTRLMSPDKKDARAPDWLTLMQRVKRSKPAEESPSAAPPTPQEGAPPRRGSVSERTLKSSKITRTLLNYFNVAVKQK